jgi:hypothetical protein
MNTKTKVTPIQQEFVENLWGEEVNNLYILAAAIEKMVERKINEQDTSRRRQENVQDHSPRRS